MLTLLVTVVVALAPAPCSAQGKPPSDMASQVERMVDLPTPAARRQAAAALAQTVGPKLDDLLAVLRGFGKFEALARGESVQRVPLQVGAKTEDTDLHLFVPEHYDVAQPAPLLLAFHGTAGSGGDEVPMWRSIAEELGMLVLAPTDAAATEGYSFSERERKAALAALRWIRRHANVDENRIFATGVSRGGHLTWDLALRFPDLFAGIAPMIGSPRITLQDGVNNLRYVENVAHLAVRDLQGAKDNAAMVFCVQLTFERLTKLGAKDAQLVLQPDEGHSFDMKAIDWKTFFGAAHRDPKPARVVRMAARDGEGRAAWVEVEDYAPSIDEVFTPTASELKIANMSDQEKLRFVETLAEQRTARLDIERASPGHFSAKSEGVKRFRVLLASDDFDVKTDVQLAWNGAKVNKRLRANPTTLLEEFAERFDRTFLPVADLDVH
jgi:dienelactone hydrolase